MCVIVDRQPGITLPKGMIANACEIDKHGWGVAHVYKGRLKYQHFPKEPNDPDEIDKLINGTLLKYRVFLHLRHATVGEVSADNAHPFPVLRKEVDGFDAGFMHNGTLSDWKPVDKDDRRSDTLIFTENYLRPLMKWGARSDGKQLLMSEFFQNCVLKEAGKNSIFLLFDSVGNVVRFNESSGKKYDGFWASNDHLETRTHHRQYGMGVYGTAWTSDYYNRNTKTEDQRAWEAYLGVDDEKGPIIGHGMGANTNAGVTMWTPNRRPVVRYVDEAQWATELQEKFNTAGYDGTELEIYQWEKKVVDQLDEITTFLKKTTLNPESIFHMTTTSSLKNLHVKRTTFVDAAGLKSLDEIEVCTKAQLSDLCRNFPEAMAELIVDLRFEALKHK